MRGCGRKEKFGVVANYAEPGEKFGVVANYTEPG
jgi:hypothetical protein